MGLKETWRHLFGRSGPPPPGRTYRPLQPPRDDRTMALASKWLEAMESGALNPPEDVHDAAGWDTYWVNNLEAGALQQGFADMMTADAGLVALLAQRRARTILCVGNGLSMEAPSLGVAGFDVTALDISGVAIATLRESLKNPEHPLQRREGYHVDAEDVVHFGRRAPGDSEPWKGPHQTPDQPDPGGGTLRFIVGDLSDPAVCHGPYDVVVERRTVQLFPKHERLPALEKLVARLAAIGVFVGHEHCGLWKPGQPRGYHGEQWLTKHGFVSCHSQDAPAWDQPGRIARLMYSTG
jgi:hypothetical protein